MHTEGAGVDGANDVTASTKPEKLTGQRSVVEVLMMGAKTAPPVRRKVKPRRKCDTESLGNIRKYLNNVQYPKECKLDVHDDGGKRKRKIGPLLEDPGWCQDSFPRRLRLMEPLQTDVKNDSMTLSHSILGAKFKNGREPRQGLLMGGSNWLELMVKKKNGKVWRIPGEFGQD